MYHADFRTFMLYQNSISSDSISKYLITFKNDEIYLPGVTKDNWVKTDEGYEVTFIGDNYTFFRLPLDLLNKEEIIKRIPEGSSENEEILNLTVLEKEKTTVCKFEELDSETEELSKMLIDVGN